MARPRFGMRSGRDGRGAGAPRRADRGLRESRGGRFLKSIGEAIPPSRCSTRRRTRSPPRCRPRARSRPSSGPRPADRGALRHPHRRGRTPRHRIPRAGDQPRGPAARPGRRRADLPLLSHGRAGRRPSARRCELVDLGPHRLRGLGAPERIQRGQGARASSPPLPAARVPISRPAGVRARGPRLFLRSGGSSAS